MSWVKLDDQWMNHPKMIRAGRDARDMWLASLTWCSQYLTDGKFPAEVIPTFAIMAGVDVANCQTFARVLLDVCLWECHDGIYEVHDFLDYNPTREQTLATREARKEAGKAGGVAKASKFLANAKQNPSKEPSKNVAKVCPVPVPLPGPVPEPGSVPKKVTLGVKGEGPAKPKPEPDPTLKDPAVIAFRNRTHITPDPEWRKRIAATVTDCERWDSTIVDWLGSGWNKRNVKGMLEVYEGGPRVRSNGREPKEHPGLTAVRLLMEEEEREAREHGDST